MVHKSVASSAGGICWWQWRWGEARWEGSTVPGIHLKPKKSWVIFTSSIPLLALKDCTLTLWALLNMRLLINIAIASSSSCERREVSLLYTFLVIFENIWLNNLVVFPFWMRCQYYKRYLICSNINCNQYSLISVLVPCPRYSYWDRQ